MKTQAEAHDPDYDQIDRNDVIEQPWHQKSQLQNCSGALNYWL